VHLHIARLDPMQVMSKIISLIRCLQMRSSKTTAGGNHEKISTKSEYKK
jgi:hypothetical protein